MTTRITSPRTMTMDARLRTVEHRGEAGDESGKADGAHDGPSRAVGEVVLGFSHWFRLRRWRRIAGPPSRSRASASKKV